VHDGSVTDGAVYVFHADPESAGVTVVRDEKGPPGPVVEYDVYSVMPVTAADAPLYAKDTFSGPP
jgi:hypothetical protein